MTVELLRAQTEARIDPDLEITLIFSLLGVALTLVSLPFIGTDLGTWLALAG
jgi:hypothetical protein